MARAKEILFRIFYSTSFTFVFLLLIVFIGATPIDTLYQSWRRDRLIDVFLITGVYVVTGLIAALIYSSRLYTNRSVLKDIPKPYMPIDKDDLPRKKISKAIQQMLAKSAVIAFRAKPRSEKIEHELPAAADRIKAILRLESNTEQDGAVFENDWGVIQHRGYASPAAKDLPNLHYATVVSQLTDLIEAKAVSLAPLDPSAVTGPDGLPTPNARVIDVSVRPEGAGMRQYINQLIELEMVPDDLLVVTFLTHYERARFASDPLSETEFQSLMRVFAEVLRKMKPIGSHVLDVLEELSDADDADSVQDAQKWDEDRLGQNKTKSGDSRSNMDKYIISAENGGRSLDATPRPPRRSRSTASNSSPVSWRDQETPAGDTASTISDNGSVIRVHAGVESLPAFPSSRVSEDSVPSHTTSESDDGNSPRTSSAKASSVINRRRTTTMTQSGYLQNASNNIPSGSVQQIPNSQPLSDHIHPDDNTSNTSEIQRRQQPHRPPLYQTRSQNSILSTRSARSNLSNHTHRSTRTTRSSRSNRSTPSSDRSVIIRLPSTEERLRRGGEGLPYTIEM